MEEYWINVVGHLSLLAETSKRGALKLNIKREPRLNLSPSYSLLRHALEISLN